MEEENPQEETQIFQPTPEEEPLAGEEWAQEDEDLASRPRRGLFGRFFRNRGHGTPETGAAQETETVTAAEPVAEPSGDPDPVPSPEPTPVGPHLVEDWDEEEEKSSFSWPWNRGEEKRQQLPPLADLPANHLTAIYANGLTQRKRHLIAALVVWLLLAYVNLTDSLNLPTLSFFWDDKRNAALGLELLGVLILLLLPTFAGGLKDLFRRRVGMNTLVSFSVLMTVLDSVAYLLVGREGPMPCVGASGLCLCCAAFGEYHKLTAQRLSCRTAAMSSHPGRLFRQEEDGGEGPILLKQEGTAEQFGAQIQEEDGVHRMTQPLVPVALVACGVLALLSALGNRRPDLILWDASVIFTLATPLSVTLAYGIPYRRIAQRLSRSGAAIAGWDGVRALAGSSMAAVVDNDLFPTGMVSCNGIRAYGKFAEELAVGYAATLVRAAGSGLEQTFANLVYTQGAKYWTEDMKDFEVYDGGGYGARIRKDEVLIGTADFMQVMGVEMPNGISVKTAAFCSINGQLAAQFALIYKMPGYVEPSLKVMQKAKLTPVLAVRDFNLSSVLLENTYNLPMSKVENPDMDTRLALGEETQGVNTPLGALLGREGLDAHCDAVLGAKRLYKVARKNGGWAMVASLVGLLMGFYLTYAMAFTALQPVNLMVFLLCWCVPAVLNALQVDRY
jgi:hypothetical protein